MNNTTNSNKLYIITTGGEDWEVIGYTDSEEEAIKICLEHNANNRVFNRYYYSEANKINSIAQKDFTLAYNYEVIYVFYNNKWWLTNVTINISGPMPYETLVSKDRRRDDVIICLFNLPELDKEKAKAFSYELLQNFLMENKDCE